MLISFLESWSFLVTFIIQALHHTTTVKLNNFLNDGIVKLNKNLENHRQKEDQGYSSA